MEPTLTDDTVVIRNLSKRRDSFALRDVNITILTGYITGLVGPNGAGKTTLLKSILGLIEPDSGDIALFGEDTTGRGSGMHDRIGVVFDRVTAAPEWKASSIGRRIARLYAHWDEQRFQDLLGRFGIPPRNRVDALSRGQAVKLSLAMALAHQPDLLVLDEPSSGLDPVARRDLADVIREFMLDPAHTVLFSTHITAELDDLADHIIVINDGSVAYSGMLDDLHEQFAVIRGAEPLDDATIPAVIGMRRDPAGGFEALIRASETSWFGPETVIDPATTDDVIVHFAEESRAARLGASQKKVDA